MIAWRWQQVGAWVALVLAAVAAVLIALRPDPYDALRRADKAFAAGKYRAALSAYSTLTETLSDAALRRGIVLIVRGEVDPARRSLIAAIKAGLRPRDYQLAVLYLGRVAAMEGDIAAARQTWQSLTRCDPDRCVQRDLLLADDDLRNGRIEEALATYRVIALDALPADWASFVIGQRAILAALVNSAATPDLTVPATPFPPDPFAHPLLPSAPDPATLAAVFAAEPAARPQLLGQLALDLGYDRLALAFLAQVDPAGPHGLAAAIYRAYAHLRLGDRQQGVEQLEQLAAAYPADPRIGPLLALAYLNSGDLEAAGERLRRLRDSGHSGPALALAEAGLALAHRDFVAAADAYEQAVIAAPIAERARYALLAARFHLDSGFERCTSGLQAAQAAANVLPNDPEALTVLAGTRYYCGDAAGAQVAAAAALEAGADVEARFYYGLALSASGDLTNGRAALELVADQAPASVWRRRAETALELLGGKRNGASGFIRRLSRFDVLFASAPSLFLG
ncbi:tetratricopeptide repeat protein [uncultured Chloroflexus sp.]|uniref:tetratricopeptide repeat protein n=2 Tax=uncultured Chloroflexus sp. TaxID=214040 RepID=UPI00262590D1|nr:tetratricopeptide repeat protein [uncultured Chloroflexus sp.]